MIKEFKANKIIFDPFILTKDLTFFSFKHLKEQGLGEIHNTFSFHKNNLFIFLWTS